MIKAVACDIDNTLTDSTSWLRLTECLGLPSQKLTSIFGAFLRDELVYAEAKRQVIELWRSSGKANRSYFERVFADWPLHVDAAAFIDCAATKGWQTVLITGSVDLFAEAIAHKLGVPHWYANTTLIWDDQDELVDMVYVKDQGTRKLQQLQEFASGNSLLLTECAILADGDNDIETFRATGNGIAVGASHPELAKVAWKQVANLSEATLFIADL